MATGSRRADGAATVVDPSGRQMKIPCWMLSPDAAEVELSTRAEICARALVALADLLEPHVKGPGGPPVKPAGPSGDSRSPAAGSHEAAGIGSGRRAIGREEGRGRTTGDVQAESGHGDTRCDRRTGAMPVAGPRKAGDEGGTR